MYKRQIRNCLLCAVVTGLVLGGGAALAGHQLLRFYSCLLYTSPGSGRAGHGGQHQLLHELLDKGGFAAAHRPHHTDVDIPDVYKRQAEKKGEVG